MRFGPENTPTVFCKFREAPSRVKRCNGDTTLWTAAGDRPKELGLSGARVPGSKRAGCNHAGDRGRLSKRETARPLHGLGRPLEARPALPPHPPLRCGGPL